MRFFACVVGAICKSPYAVACVFSSNRSHCKFAHVFNSPMWEGELLTYSAAPARGLCPYTGVFWTFANIHVNTQKTSQAWCEYVCARCRGELEFALVANRPYRELCFQVLKIVKINTINKIKSANIEKNFYICPVNQKK